MKRGVAEPVFPWRFIKEEKMRRLVWLVLCGGLVFALGACEVEEGEGGEDAGTTADTGSADTGSTPAESQVCADDSLRQASCLAEFFSCFDPSGACNIEDSTDRGNVPMEAIVFANGAEWQFGTDDVTGDAITRAIASNGSTCATGTGTEPVDGQRTITFALFADSSTELTIETDPSGNMVVTCPDDTEEPYGAGNAATILGCQGAVCQ